MNAKNLGFLIIVIITYIMWLLIMSLFTNAPNQKYMEFHYRVFQNLCETNYENLELEVAKQCSYFTTQENLDGF